MKYLLAAILMFSLSLTGLDFMEKSFAQEKTTHTAIRVDTLRRRSDSVARTYVSSSFDSSRVSKNWSHLKKGLSEQAVRDLLGRPTKIEFDVMNGFSSWWYGKRSVLFRSFTRRLIEWDQ
jgi:hypothetical protein